VAAKAEEQRQQPSCNLNAYQLNNAKRAAVELRSADFNQFQQR